MSDPRPELSVVIASHNRCPLLRRCLESLASQTADPASFEVIVADDDSGDETVAMVEALATPYRLRVLQLSKRGQAAAQNAAIEAAAGAVCLTLDDDVIAAPTLIAAHAAAHREEPLTIGVGNLEQPRVEARSWFSRSARHGWAEHYAALANRPASWSDCFGANISFPREALLAAGGIATDLDVAFDLEIGLRLSQRGCVPRFLPAASGLHDDGGKGTRGILRDARRQGAAHVELAQRYPEQAGDLLNWRLGGRGERLCRRLALAGRVSSDPLAALGRLIPGAGRKMIWMHFVHRLAFWEGVRKATDPAQWSLLSSDRATPTHGLSATEFSERAPQ
jgi:glycosyltransferase involved in cell wall biosynthesis